MARTINSRCINHSHIASAFLSQGDHILLLKIAALSLAQSCAHWKGGVTGSFPPPVWRRALPLGSHGLVWGRGPDGPVGSGGVFCVLAGTSRPSGSVPSPQSDVHTSPVDPVAGSSGCCRNALTSACKTAGPAFDRFLFLTQPPAQPSQHPPRVLDCVPQLLFHLSVPSFC